MKLSEIEHRMVAWYIASNSPGGGSLRLRSRPGVGKSSTLGTVAAKLNAHFPGKNYGFQCVNGATVTLTTATGYLMPEERDGVKYSEFTRPSWWTTPEGKPLEAYDGGVILVDEDDKLGSDEKKIMGEAALSKILGNHRLPPGWVVWFAGNRASDRSGSTKDFDHLISRMLEINVTDDIQSTLAYLERVGVLPETRHFAEENPHLVFMDMPEKQGPWLCPRSLHQSDIHLRALMVAFGTDVVPTDPTTVEEITGKMGPGAASQYMNSIKLGQELPPYAAIIANPETVPVPSKPDGKRLGIYKIAYQVTAKDMGQALKYIKRMPDEFQIIFGKSAIMRNNQLVIHKDFAAWAATKSSLIDIMSKLK